MADTISKMPVNNSNGISVTQVADKDRDVERGEICSAVGVSSSSHSQPTTAAALASLPTPTPMPNPVTVSAFVATPTSLHASSTAAAAAAAAAGGRYDMKTIGGVGYEVNVLSADAQDLQSTRVSVTANAMAAAASVRSEKDQSVSGRRNRWKAVGRVFRRLTLIMLLLAALTGALAVLVIYMGPIYLIQLLVVVSVAYFVAGGRLKWFYVAFRTLPRDIKAAIGYIRLLWLMRDHSRKNRNVADIFKLYVNRHPNKVCFIFEDQEWSFQQVEDFSNKIATIFKMHGYKKGDIVALFLENRPEFPGIWLGLSKLGVITPLINTNQRKNSLLHSINVIQCQALIYGAELFDAVADIASSLDVKLALYRFGSHPNAMSVGLKEKDLNSLLIEVSAIPPIIQEKCGYNDKLLYIYTSGTTGLPKAAVITNARYMFIASSVHIFGNLRNSDRIYTPLPMYHTAGGVIAIGQALLHGHTTVIRKKFSASSYFNDCIKYKCTVAQYIGEMCRYVLAIPPKKEDKEHNIKLIVGNGLRPQIWTEFVERFNIPQVLEFYGATEGNANIINIDNKVGAVGFISRIIPSIYPISIIKVDADGEPIRNSKGLCQICEPNEPGVFIGKITQDNPTRAFLGYVDRSASEKKIVRDVFIKGDSAFLSGDIVVADEFGYLYFKDRTGDTFRWKGENVSTSEIEGIVSNLIDYRDCIVYSIEIRGAEGRAGMAAIYDENGMLDIHKLAFDIKKHLPTYSRPQFIRILTKIDLTGTFKLKKKDLQEEGYNPYKIQDKLYYLDSKLGYLPLTSEIYDQIQQGRIKF